METNWAAEHLQVIRTLMERSALYRRALAPVMTFVGVVGIVGGVVGWKLELKSDLPFIGFWLMVGVLAFGGAFLLTRRQALKAAEPFWTPPTRRVMQAIAPPLSFGSVLALIFLGIGGSHRIAPALLPPVWMALYGCSLHAAGFFMPRGIRLLGWLFILLGSALLILAFGLRLDLFADVLESGHLVMGTGFGVLHLAYGVYLYFTEKRGNES
jgi:hypothetical protein